MPNYYETPQYDSDFLFRLLLNDEKMSVRPHYHTDIEIIVVDEGSLTLMIDNHLFSLKENDFILIPSFKMHFILPKKNNTHFVFQFSTSIFDQKILNKMLTSIDCPILSETLTDPYKKSIQSKLEIIKQEWEMEIEGFEVIIESLLQNILINIGRNLSLFSTNKELIKSKELKQPSQLILEVVHYIEHHYIEKLTLDDISAHVNLSKYHFSRVFKNSLGMSFSDYLTHYRINRAKFMLSETTKAIEEIGYLVGFTYPQSFYRSFKKTAGLSPNEYREWLNSSK